MILEQESLSSMAYKAFWKRGMVGNFGKGDFISLILSLP